MSEYLETEYPGTTATSSSPDQPDDPSAKDKAIESAQAGKQAAGEVTQTAVSKAQDVVGEGKAQARNLVGEARDQLRTHASEQHRNAVTNLRSLADELNSMAQAGDQGGIASDLVGQAADRAHGAASWLDRREPGDLVEELRRFARRRPGAFLAGALVAGVLAGRLTRGVVAAHAEDDGSEAEARPSRHSQAGGGDDPRSQFYGDGQAGTYAGGQPGPYVGGQPGPYVGGQHGAESGWDPTGVGPSSGPGVRP